MDAPPRNALAAFGFITVVESADHGLFGGYLVLSPQGRPLEFRCTTPVAATRAQEILYGPTLRPYLLGEVIGPALVGGAELPVEVLLTDQRDMLALAIVRNEQVLLVEPLEDPQVAASSTAQPAAASAHTLTRGDLSFEIGGCRITAADTSSLNSDALQALLQPLAAHVFLAEPFERIRAALHEAQQASRLPAEPHGDCSIAA